MPPGLPFRVSPGRSYRASIKVGAVEEDLGLQERVLVSRVPVPLAVNETSNNPLLPSYTSKFFFTMEEEHAREFRKTIAIPWNYMQSDRMFSIHICSIKLSSSVLSFDK